MTALFQLKKRFPPFGFFTPRALVSLVFCAAAGFIVTGTLLAFSRSEAPAKLSQKTLTFAERVAYQRASEVVYWRHRIWPKERPDPKPSLDVVMSQAQLENKVADYLRKSQALQDYWQRPLTAEQLQAEIDRMAQHTKQPEVLRELFEALGNDPFVIAECLARPALAERLIRSWYAYDQRIHGELRQRAEVELQAHPTVDQMKQTSGTYSEIELVRSDSGQDLDNRRAEPGVKLNSREWDEKVQKLAAMFGDTKNAGAPITQIKTGVLSSLQEDEGRYYATAVVKKSEDYLKLATVEWRKEPLESWTTRAENLLPVMTAKSANYTLPAISDAPNGCIDDTWASTSIDVPRPRHSHTAVWTGSEMIIWGGRSVFPVNTGDRYSPSTDTWTPTRMTSVPSGRYLHTAVWTGSEMIVWGGIDESANYSNTGGRYNPGTDTWIATGTRAPIGRALHTAVWTGSEMIVWGGFNGSALRSGSRYNPVTDHWTLLRGTPPAARYLHTAVWTGSEMIVWGGYDGNSYLNTGGRYTPNPSGRNSSWIATSSNNAPTGREMHTAVWTGSEMIIWGGNNGSALNTGARYRPSTDMWTAASLTNAPSGRYLHTAVWTGNELIVWGGIDQSANYVSTGGRYNPNADTWAATSPINVPDGRFLHTAVWTGSEMIICGGYNGSALNTGGRYDPNGDSWIATSTSTAPTGRVGHTAVWTGTEMIVWGGDDGSGLFGPVGTGGRYDPATDNWTATDTSSAPSARAGHTAVWTGSEMIIWGGYNQWIDPINFLNTGGRYNPITDSWTATSTTNAPEARDSHTAVWTGSEMIVWAGRNIDVRLNFVYLDTGGKYNPSTNSWTPTNTTNAPAKRGGHTAVWTGSEMIVWGGVNDLGVFNTGGRYNPGTDSWIATTTTNAPAARYGHTAVWTGSEMIVWGAGSNTGGRYHPSTNSWTPTSTTNAPAARYGHTAVWTGGQMIVWGGYSGAALNTGGRYHPSTDSWTVTSTTNAPAARSGQAAVWTGSEMIVWSGNDNDFHRLNTGGRYCAQSGPTLTP